MSERQATLLLAALGAGIVGLILVALSLHQAGSIWAGTLLRKDWIVGLMAAAALLYFGAVRLVLRAKLAPWAIWCVLGVAIVLRAALIPAPPFMSSDVYRYVWDGRVQQAGINPYRYIPADPALAGLRDADIYPRINRAGYAHTIYPPMAQAIFRFVALFSQTVVAMKLAMVLLEAAGIAAMLRLLALCGLPPARVLIYAWNPLAAWAVAGDGHIDGAAIGLLGLALLARARRSDGLAGALLAGAILTKFLPLAVAPALWRRWHWRMPLACLACIVALYACYAGAGWHVLGFLPNYTAEEGLAQGSGFWLLGVASLAGPLPHAATTLYLLACVALLGTAAFHMAFLQREHSDPGREAIRIAGNCAILAGLTLAAMSPHYPWYYPWIALPACLAPLPSLIALSVVPLILYCDPFHDEIVFPTLVFVPIFVLALRDWAGRLPRSLALPGAA
jgi:hypothetical protein